jgi:hypothetical protein
MSERKRFDMAGEAIWLAPPEYVILRKLEYYKEGLSDKHLRDISSMLEISSGKIDLDKLHEKVREYGLEKEWEKAKK